MRSPSQDSPQAAGALPPAPRLGPPPPLDLAYVDDVVRRALEEDVESGDLTSSASVPKDARARARLLAKASGVLAGLSVFARTFELCDPNSSVVFHADDGARCEPKDVLAVVEGNARSLLTAERTALNLIQRMCGVATATARFVELANGGARILDTRKTNPTLRVLDKYAVRCGGGENHRFGLFDEVMLKENHIDLAGRPLVEVVAAVRAEVGTSIRITCEARDEREAHDGIRGGADVILLDNMTPDQMTDMIPRLREAAREVGQNVELEASGGVDQNSVAIIAQTGVDRISVGALTHSAPALDLSLYLEPLP